MSPPVYVAIDQGGHATRASAYTADGTIEGAALVTIATQRNALGHVEHDPEEVVASVTTALAELARIVPPARWAAAGLAVQRSSLACWDATDGRALAPVISWQDTRAAAWLKGLARRAEDVQRITGLHLSPHYGASKLRWCLDHVPEVRSAAAQSRLRAGPLASWLLHRLLEERPLLADASTAARTLLWSPFTREWSEELLALFGIPHAILPRATGTSHAFGTLACEGARVPLNTCNGDQSVVPFAAGPLDFDAAYVNLGTGAFVLRPTTEALRAPPLLTSVIRADEEHCDFVLEGSVNGAGAALAWLEVHQGAAADRLLGLLDRAPLVDEEAPFFLNGVVRSRVPVLATGFRIALRRRGLGPAAVPRGARERRLPDQGEPGRDGPPPPLARAPRRERRPCREPPAVPHARLPRGVAGRPRQRSRGDLTRARLPRGRHA